MNIKSNWVEKLKPYLGRIILSFGGGVDSHALYLLLLDAGFVPGRDFFAVYVDHGCDWPESREAVRRFSERYDLMIITPFVEGYTRIFDYFWCKEIIPVYKGKSCTVKFKQDALHRAIRYILAAEHYDWYENREYVQVLGFNADEAYRVDRSADIFQQGGVPNVYPLVEEGIGREACKAFIAKHGVPVPPKSSCFFCPASKPAEWRALRSQHPDLFLSAQLLEERSNARRAKEGKGPIYINAKSPLCEVVNEDMHCLTSGMAEARFPEPDRALWPRPASDLEYVQYLADLEAERRYGPHYRFCLPGYFEDYLEQMCRNYDIPYVKGLPAMGQPVLTYNILKEVKTPALQHLRNRVMDEGDAWADLMLEMAGGCLAGSINERRPTPKAKRVERAPAVEQGSLPGMPLAA